MHTLKIAVVTPPEGAGYEEIRASIAERIASVPTLRWRLGFGPGGVGRPYWVEDEHFDLDLHLVRKQLAAPGGRAELCELVARGAEAPLLDRSRPLWQIWIVEGLEGGRIAVIARVHHAFADGVSFARILASWFAPEPGQTIDPPGPTPGTVGYLEQMLTAGTREQLHSTAAFVRAARAAQRPKRPEVPATPFNGRRLAPGRRFACQALPLDAIHAARKPLEATVNDMLVALVADVLRAHLRDLGALPDAPLVATMPVSLLTPEEHAPIGNRGLAATLIRLPTDVDDPIDRVRAARANSRAAKAELAATRGARIDNAVDLLPRRAVRGAARLLDSARGGRLGNLSVSNVRGPAEPLATDGFVAEDFFSVGPCMPSCGLNITAWSYAGRFNVSMLTDTDAVDDPWEVVERLPQALDRLTPTTERPRRPSSDARAPR